MSKSLLNIDKFPTGIINDATKQTVDGFVDMLGIDMHTNAGVAQLNDRLENDTTTGLTNRPLSAVIFDGKILVGTENEEIWHENTANTWTLLHTNTNPGDIEDLVVYQDHLIYASIDELGRSTTTTIAGGFTDNPTWGSGTNAFENGTNAGPHFFKIFNNRLYISDGNIIAELDGASDPANPGNWVFTANAFELPRGEVIVSMEVIGSLLGIGTKSGTYYEWDGSSANASTIVKSNLGGIYALINIENTLFAFAGIYGTVYRFNGSDFKPDIQIPRSIFNVSSTSHTRKPAVRRYRNGFIFAIPNNGIYVYDRFDSGSKFILTKYGNLSGGKIIDEFEGDIRLLFMKNINSAVSDFIVGYKYLSTTTIDSTGSVKYRMFEAGSGDDSASPYIETQQYELRNNNGKPTKVQGVQGLFNDTGESPNFSNIRVYYRLDRDTSYTLLGDIGNDGIDFDKILRGISKRAHKVQFKILMGAETTSSVNDRNTKITGLRIF